MTRFIHDQFSKDYLEELLKPYGEVSAPSRVAGEIREIDVLFYPFTLNNSNLEILGLLGKLAAKPAIFEPFRNAASKEEICDCLLKLLAVRGKLQRDANRQPTKISQVEVPHLWILTPTASSAIISGFNATEKLDWMKGIYFLGEYLRTALVVIHHLPITPETLWLRILGRGAVQKQAIDELESLPSNHPFQKATIELLYNLQQNLKINESPETEDRELIMRLAPLYQQDKEQAVQQGLQKGLQQGEQTLILRQLNCRIGTISPLLIERIQRLSIQQLEDLGEALLDFSEVKDLENWFDL